MNFKKTSDGRDACVTFYGKIVVAVNIVDSEQKLSPAYVSFKTFLNAIERLEHGLPDHIDKSLFHSLAGGIQTNLMRAFRFLDLITADGSVLPPLRQLVESTEEQRPHVLGEILKQRYAKVMALDLMKCSPHQFTEAMKAYGIQGDTLQRAVWFFVTAAKFSGISMSPHLLKGLKAHNVAGTRRKRNGGAVGAREQDNDEDEIEDEEQQQPPSGTSKTVELRSGGSLTVTASVDLFAMSAEDRSFVFKLIDDLQAYQKLSETDLG